MPSAPLAKVKTAPTVVRRAGSCQQQIQTVDVMGDGHRHVLVDVWWRPPVREPPDQRDRPADLVVVERLAHELEGHQVAHVEVYPARHPPAAREIDEVGRLPEIEGQRLFDQGGDAGLDQGARRGEVLELAGRDSGKVELLRTDQALDGQIVADAVLLRDGPGAVSRAAADGDELDLRVGDEGAHVRLSPGTAAYYGTAHWIGGHC